VERDFGGIEINEVPDTMIRYATELSPIPESPNRGLFASWENAAIAESENICELIGLRCRYLGFHVSGCASTHAATDRLILFIGSDVTLGSLHG
jgi:hypothetical protein